MEALDKEEKINILISHGDLLKESYYNPMTLYDIEKSNADYSLGRNELFCKLQCGSNYD